MADRRRKILVVDDEYRIGMLIKKLIHTEQLECSEIEVTDRGEKALEILKNQPIDIVITDIRMPVISGLDLIRLTKEMKKDVKFVVVSGYKEFEYAHKALQYGVDDYLLKPINEEELNHVLEKILQELARKEQQGMETRHLREKLQESRQIIKREFLRDLIEKEEVTQEDSGINLEGEIYRGIDIKLDYVDCQMRDKKQDRLVMEKVTEMLETILTQKMEEVLICEKENLHIFCLFNYKANKSKAVKKCINEILSEIQGILLGLEQYEVTIGVGEEKQDFSEIRFSILEASRAAANRIRLGTGRLIYAEALKKADGILDGIKEKTTENFVDSLRIYSGEKMDQCINEIYEEYLSEGEASWCYEAADYFVQLFFSCLDSHQEEWGSIRERLREQCQHCRSVVQLKQLLKTELGQILNNSRKAMESESAKPVRQAKEYMEAHYGEKIGLEDMAELAQLNPVYFSVLFKKETGRNFSVYLTELRMEKAKTLLCSTNETIAAVAEKVGYKDSRYFSQIFAKTVGIKPALYRKLHS